MAFPIDNPLGYEQINDLSSAVGLTVPDHATKAVIQAMDQAVRWRDDGTSPTATVGMVLAAGASITFTGSLSAFEAIEASAGAELNVTYYGG